ncbi:hypothetical protein CLOM_g3775 [Closterium sp. NIES-68]|nr:hypothetical protein CLOM_g3775 [Closterium sp. NIES-68]
MASSFLRPAVSQHRFCSSPDAASPSARQGTACLAMAPNASISLHCTHQSGLRFQTSGTKSHSRRNVASSFFGDSLARSQLASTPSGLQPQGKVARRKPWSAPQAVFQWGKRPEYKGTPPRVIVVTSGKGGVGKTTIVANIGMCLARLEFKVVAIDCDVGLRNLDLLLGMEARVFHTVQDVLAGEARLDQALVRDKRVPNFELLCISKPRSKIDLNFSGKSLILLVEALREREEGCPDFILLDCPAGIEAGFITAITPANEAIIVTTPDVTCLRDADRVAGAAGVRRHHQRVAAGEPRAGGSHQAGPDDVRWGRQRNAGSPSVGSDSRGHCNHWCVQPGNATRTEEAAYHGGPGNGGCSVAAGSRGADGRGCASGGEKRVSCFLA